MRRCGVTASIVPRLVVAYDAATGTSAARAWWLLRYFGHPNAALLDGGYAAWVAAGLPVIEGDDHDPAAGDFEPVPGGMPLLDADGAAAMARDRDAHRCPRSRSAFAATPNRWIRWPDTFPAHAISQRSRRKTPDGHFLAPADLR